RKIARSRRLPLAFFQQSPPATAFFCARSATGTAFPARTSSSSLCSRQEFQAMSPKYKPLGTGPGVFAVDDERVSIVIPTCPFTTGTFIDQIWAVYESADAAEAAYDKLQTALRTKTHPAASELARECTPFNIVAFLLEFLDRDQLLGFQ